MKLRLLSTCLLAWLASCSLLAGAFAQVEIGIQIGSYPEMVPVPGYPVYYAPRIDSNYFFYDGLYWVFLDDNWYQSTWYNGPWYLTDPDQVPLFILRVPVRYYRQPPLYFGGWQGGRPPHWGEHWGSDWEEHRSGWDRWNRQTQPVPAPLPSYQNNFAGTRYPDAEQQRRLQGRNYPYQGHSGLQGNGNRLEPPQRSPGPDIQGQPPPRGQGEPPPGQPRRQQFAPQASRQPGLPVPVGQGEPPPGQPGRPASAAQQQSAPSPRRDNPPRREPTGAARAPDGGPPGREGAGAARAPDARPSGREQSAPREGRQEGRPEGRPDGERGNGGDRPDGRGR